MPNVGDPILASQFNGLLSPWQAYVPALTAATTNPTLGTGGATAGAYMQVGKTVIGWGSISFGTAATAAGTGIYTVSLPVASANGTPLHGTFRAKCAGTYTRGDLTLATATTVDLVYTSTAVSGALTFVANATPGAWTVNDGILYNFTYQAA